jgi:hypothetical protein
MRTLPELVADLRTVFSGPEKWTQHALARDKDQIKTGISDPSTVCYCLLGGMWLLDQGRIGGVLEKLGRAALGKLYPPPGRMISSISIAEWQDHPSRTFADIQNLLTVMEEMAPTYSPE